MGSCEGGEEAGCGVHSCSWIAAEGVEIDLRVRCAGVVAGDGEGAIVGRSDVGSDGVCEAGGGWVEE
jgi:hypothetical protein